MIISRTLALNDEEVKIVENFLELLKEIARKTDCEEMGIFEYFDRNSKTDVLHRIKIEPIHNLDDIENYC